MKISVYCHAMSLVSIFALAMYALYDWRTEYTNYINLASNASVYFCNNGPQDCTYPYGQILCPESLCPISNYAYCKWNTSDWNCYASLRFDLEIVNANVECTRNPYGDWVEITSCTLKYEVGPKTQGVWFPPSLFVDFSSGKKLTIVLILFFVTVSPLFSKSEIQEQRR
jgi:hypothetical protein